jgi:chemotaxis regulatin CheY-phosphate phosphatase CheZ
MADEVTQLKQRIGQLTRELHEYIRAEEVLIAAGIVTKEKVEQAHDIVRDFAHG